YSVVLASAPRTAVLSTLSLHDALPIYVERSGAGLDTFTHPGQVRTRHCRDDLPGECADPEVRVGERLRRRSAQRHHRSLQPPDRSEEHTSELQSRFDLVCRLLL